MWWFAVALVGLALIGAATVWGASALWVRIISRRWDAMCAEEEPKSRRGS